MRIVILRTDRLGELVLTLPLASALRRTDAAAHVTFVVRDMYRELVQLAPDAQEVLTVPWDGAPGVALAREMLYNPNWAMDAAQKLGCDAKFMLAPPPYRYWLERRALTVPEVRPSTFGTGI